MSTELTRAPDEVAEIAKELMEDHWPDLVKAKVTFHYLMATNPDGPALKHSGRTAAALVRIIPYADRVKGLADVEMKIDSDFWDNLTTKQKIALVDHELEHVLAQWDEGELVTDALGRPKIKMKPHDEEHGWFSGNAERHGEDSPEVIQARNILEKHGAAFFPGVKQELRLVQ